MPKDNGEFYTDDNIIYKTYDTNFLRADREYLLKIMNKLWKHCHLKNKANR